MLYSTYLGGNDSDLGFGITLDSMGYVYVVGDSYSTDFPLLNPYQTEPGDFDSDVVIARLDPGQSGNDSLLYSTYLGGDGYDGGDDIEADGNGSVYVTGLTDSNCRVYRYPLSRFASVDRLAFFILFRWAEGQWPACFFA